MRRAGVWTAVLLLLVLLAVPSTAPAQCTLVGHGQIEGVRPTGTELSVGLDEAVEVTLRGSRAAVRGVARIELTGRARARDVHVTLREARRAHGVLALEAGTALRVLRERDGRVQLRLEVGGARVHLEVPCDAIGLDTPRAETPPPATEERELARARGRSLAVFPRASGGHPLVLRARAPFPALEVLERRDRWHVRAELAPGVVLDGWIDPDAFARPGSAPDDSGSSSGGACGWSYPGERHRGAATIAAGAALVDPHGFAFARTLAEVHAEIAISVFVSSTSHGTRDTETVETTEQRTVHVERMEGFLTPPCGPLGFVVDEGAVRASP